MNKLVIGTFLSFLSISAFSYCEQHGNALGKIGIEGFEVVAELEKTGTNYNCGCQSVRFSPDKTDVEKAMSIMLTAKLTNKKIRVDFSDGPECDEGKRVYIH